MLLVPHGAIWRNKRLCVTETYRRILFCHAKIARFETTWRLPLSGVNGLEVLSDAMPIIIDGEGEDVSRARRKGPTREANNIIRARA